LRQILVFEHPTIRENFEPQLQGLPGGIMSLQDRLNAFKADFESKVPPEKLAIMHRATEDLRRSGILDRVLKVGASLPEFTLPNYRGDNVSSVELLQRGPLVVTFYRGVW
jgi:hypothetical protein